MVIYRAITCLGLLCLTHLPACSTRHAIMQVQGYPGAGPLLVDEGAIRDGIVKDGTTTLYYENGRKWHEAGFHNYRLHGTSRTWYPDGQLKSERSYEDGAPTGWWREYFPNGVVATELRFDRFGAVTDSYRFYEAQGLRAIKRPIEHSTGTFSFVTMREAVQIARDYVQDYFEDTDWDDSGVFVCAFKNPDESVSVMFSPEEPSPYAGEAVSVAPDGSIEAVSGGIRTWQFDKARVGNPKYVDEWSDWLP